MNKFISILILVVLLSLALQKSVIACGCGCANKPDGCGMSQNLQNEKSKYENLFCGGTGLLANDQKTKVEYSNELIHSCYGSCINGGNKK